MIHLNVIAYKYLEKLKKVFFFNVNGASGA